MKHAHPQSTTARRASVVLLVTVALAGLASPAQARNVRLMGSVDDATRLTHVHDILGTLDLRFGSDSGRGASIMRRDVVVKGVGTTNLNDVHVDDAKARPADQDLCARAFEDAVMQLAFAARGARATAIVGVVSDYDGKVFDDPAHFECHAGALKAAVTLRAQLATGAAVPVLSPPPVPASPPPAALPATPEPDVAPPPAATFQPLPPRPASAPN
jgi:hypothetical protein